MAQIDVRDTLLAKQHLAALRDKWNVTGPKLRTYCHAFCCLLLGLTALSIAIALESRLVCLYWIFGGVHGISSTRLYVKSVICCDLLTQPNYAVEQRQHRSKSH